jgi:hypothetical protein
MPSPQEPVTLSPEQIKELQAKLSKLRHNVNNHLSLIIAASELIRRKPEMIERMLNTLTEQPRQIQDELRTFSDDLEKVVGIRRDPG